MKTAGPAHVWTALVATWLNVALSYTQPFIIQRIITAMNEPELDVQTANGLLGATVLSYFAFAVSLSIAPTHEFVVY